MSRYVNNEIGIQGQGIVQDVSTGHVAVQSQGPSGCISFEDQTDYVYGHINPNNGVFKLNSGDTLSGHMFVESVCAELYLSDGSFKNYSLTEVGHRDFVAGFTRRSLIGNFNELFHQTNPGHPAHLVIVAKNGSDTTGLGTNDRPFLTISHALSTITDSAIDNLYLVVVNPGIYIEPILVIPDFTSLCGASINSVVIEPSTSGHHIVDMGDESEISFLTLRNAGVGYAALTTTRSIYYWEAHKVSILDSDIGVLVDGTSGDIEVYLEYVDIDEDYTNAVKIISDNGYTAYVNAENFYTYPTGTNVDAEIYISGSGSVLQMLACGITGNTNNDGIFVTNGSHLDLRSLVFSDCARGVYSDVSGVGSSTIYMSGISFEDCDMNIDIASVSAIGNYTGYSAYNKTYINPNNYFFITNKDPDIITVGKKGADFTSIAAACDSITDSDENNRYLVLAGPGVFIEPQINVPPYTTIRGQAIQNTIVEPDSNDHSVFVQSIGCEILFLTVRNAGTGYAAFECSNCGDFSQTNKISIYDSDIGILLNASTIDSLHYAEYVDFNGTYTHAVKCVSVSGFSARVNAENVYSFPGECLGPQFLVTGEYSELGLLAGNLFGDDSGTDIVVAASGGADVQINAIVIDGAGTGVHILDDGVSGVTLNCNAVTLKCINKDINIESTLASGAFSGMLSRSKYYNASSNGVLFTYQDIEDGDFNITRILATKGFATDLTTITSASQTTQMVSYDSHVYIITGSTAGQVLRLPDATTLRKGHQFFIMNESSVDVDIQDYSGTLDQTLKSESNTLKILRTNSTSAGLWTKSVGVNFAVGKLRDPRFFAMNGTVSNGDWISISNLLSNYKYVFTEPVKLIGMEWSNDNGNGRDFDLVFYKNGTAAGNIVRTYQVRNSTYDYGSESGWDNEFAAGDYMRIQYVDQGDNVSDFGGRFNFEVLTQ